MQKKTIRAICKASYNDHMFNMFKTLEILPLKYLITYSQSLLMHSIIHKYSPPILHNQWITNVTRNPNVELRNANDLYVTTALSEQVKKLPLVAFAVVWNNLPDNKLHRNPNLFKSLLKEHVWSLVTE
jgi:hypothetical protein